MSIITSAKKFFLHQLFSADLKISCQAVIVHLDPKVKIPHNYWLKVRNLKRYLLDQFAYLLTYLLNWQLSEKNISFSLHMKTCSGKNNHTNLKTSQWKLAAVNQWNASPEKLFATFLLVSACFMPLKVE